MRAPRASVFRYQTEWQELSNRIGYWLDYDHPYVTCSNEYVESVWWMLKRLHEKGLLQPGHRVLPYCPRCGTVLSSHELALGYEEIRDRSIYVTFPLERRQRARARGLDHDTLDAARERGGGGPSRARVRRVRLEGWAGAGVRRGAGRGDRARRPRRAGRQGRSTSATSARRALRRGREYVGLSYRRPLEIVPLPEDRRARVVVPATS